jgi:hypothetical protein
MRQPRDALALRLQASTALQVKDGDKIVTVDGDQ